MNACQLTSCAACCLGDPPLCFYTPTPTPPRPVPPNQASPPLEVSELCCLLCLLLRCERCDIKARARHLAGSHTFCRRSRHTPHTTHHSAVKRMRRRHSGQAGGGRGGSVCKGPHVSSGWFTVLHCEGHTKIGSVDPCCCSVTQTALVPW